MQKYFFGLICEFLSVDKLYHGASSKTIDRDLVDDLFQRDQVQGGVILELTYWWGVAKGAQARAERARVFSPRGGRQHSLMTFYPLSAKMIQSPFSLVHTLLLKWTDILRKQISDFLQGKNTSKVHFLFSFLA